MVRFAILVLFVPFTAAQSGDYTTCNEISATLTECLVNTNATAIIDPASATTTTCIECLTGENFFTNFDGTKASCSTAKSEICGFLNDCQDGCLPKLNVCQEEYDAYNECYLGLAYAPDGCLVQCDGTTSDGDSNTDGGANNSGSSSSSSMTFTASTMFLVVAMLGSGLLGSRF